MIMFFTVTDLWHLWSSKHINF